MLVKPHADERDDRDAGEHHVGVEKFLRAEDEPAQSPRHRGQHLDRHQDAPSLRQPKPQAGHDVRQRAGQNHVAKQAAIVGPHGMR
jgi:hypothetical protein